MDILLPLLLQVVLIGLNAIFACAEIAVIQTNDAKLDKLSEDGNKKAKTLVKLKSNPAGFLATIQIAITLSGFLGSAFAAENFAGYLVKLIPDAVYSANEAVFDSVAVVVITLILSYFTLIFGELVPKRLAMKKPEAISFAIGKLLYVISKIFKPVVWFLTISTNAVLRLCGIDPNESEDDVSEEDIRLMVDAASESEAIDESEKEMIQNVFEFDDLLVSDFVTHRMNVVMLWNEDPIEEWDRTIRENSYTYYPVCGETPDDILGVISTKLYFRLDDKSKESVMKHAMKPAMFIPASLRADTLFAKMKQTKNHFAVVLDDYGGVLGIITMNDILEQLVGDFNDDVKPADTLEPVMEQLSDDEWFLTGAVLIDKVNEIFRTDFSEAEYDTFGGLVLSEYGSVPADGTTFEITIGKLRIFVDLINDHRIEKARVKVQNEASDDE